MKPSPQRLPLGAMAAARSALLAALEYAAQSFQTLLQVMPESYGGAELRDSWERWCDSGRALAGRLAEIAESGEGGK